MNKTGTTGTYGTIVENRKRMDLFLEKMRTSGNVRLSCTAAGIGRTTVYRWRRKWATFAAEWDEAMEDACDVLEGVAWKRAIKMSDRLLMFLLKAHRPDRYKERVKVETEVTGNVTLVFGGNIDPKDL